MFASATLYVLLEPILHIGYFSFLGIVVYRLIYYVIPLVLALLLLVGHEAQHHREIIKRSSARTADWLSAIVPQVMGVVVFLTGVVLLISGAMPAVESRLMLISKVMPLPLLELSHMSGSVTGVALLILARGLYRRLHRAYLLAVAALSCGMFFSLSKGLDYEEALVLGVILVSLWLCRNRFYRRGSMSSQPYSLRWIGATAVALGLALWVGLVSFHHVEYSDQLWWQFARDAQAPRMLRAALITAILALSFALWKVLSGRSRGAAYQAVPDERKHLVRAIATAQSASANIALMGDKQFLWSDDRLAFVMYQVCGRSWIALGEPVGPKSHWEDLIWSFRDLVDRHDGRTVFYEVGEESLYLYLDLGLALFKLGEDARVSLEDFSLQGSHRAGLRQADNRAKKHGAVFEVVPRNDVPSILPELRQVSDEWLADKSTAEKGFSLGSFSEDYILNFDCSVVRVEGVIVAFTNLWTAPQGGELSVDLMRFSSRAPKGVMDFLFVELMLWGAAHDYRWFSLGMAPLAGLDQHSLAPMWHKLGHLVFTHGEHFYNFEGLRTYKEKFDPQWKPRYLACPSGWLNLPQSLFDASRLISGDVTGTLVKRHRVISVTNPST